MDSPTLTATYRLQMNSGFRLADARAVAPYLEHLGVSHLYLSPILAAKPGSLHGYDVVDPTRLNPEVGSEDELRTLASDLRQRDMSIVLDIVPNHMGTGPANPYWDDLLANGRQSRWAHWFDVDWDSERPSLRGCVMVPVLGDTLEAVIDRGELSLVREGDRIRVKYADHTFPLSLEAETSLRDEDLSRWSAGETGRIRMRALLDAQRYRLAFWKRASVAVNYRRFFDVTELIALRMHDPAVFRETHALILRWVEASVLGGLRIDHVDGLLDPQAYLDTLREEVTQRRPADAGALPIVVEKILSPGERLRETWPVQGTTGYEFLNDLEAIFVEANGAERMAEGHRRVVGTRASGGFEEAALRGKELVLRATLAADVARLARLLRRVLQHGRSEQRALAGMIRRFITTLPVYRTYVGDRGPVHADDRDVIARAVETAAARWGARRELERLAGVLTSPEGDDAMQFVGRLQQTTGPATAKGVEDTALYRYAPLASLNEVGGNPGRDLHRAVHDLHVANETRQARWPASLLCTSTHDTKRSADVRSRLDVLSEMPEDWLRAVRRWRRLLARNRARVRGGMAPDAATEWLLFQSLLGLWPAELDAEGASRELRDRIVEYMRKANREAKVRTSWTSPDDSYERSVESYIDAALGDHTFLTEMAAWAARIAPAGYCNGLSRLVVHLTAPGTPDIYQGDELWNFTLVDPDNRRQVDFAGRRNALDRIDEALGRGDAARECAEMLGRVADGRIKMHVTRSALRARRDLPAPFLRGAYAPLSAEGAKGQHAFAFMRVAEAHSVVTAVTRLPVALSGTRGIPTGLAWGDSAIIFPGRDVPRRWRCAFTGLTVETQEMKDGTALLAREVFLTLPVALLIAA